MLLSVSVSVSVSVSMRACVCLFVGVVLRLQKSPLSLTPKRFDILVEQGMMIPIAKPSHGVILPETVLASLQPISTELTLSLSPPPPPPPLTG